MRWENVHDHLFSPEEGIADEFARSQRYRLLAVCHDERLVRVSVLLGKFGLSVTWIN